MPDDLYERDILLWSERQADLLRRAARGERVNDVDWDHVVEEIEDVGLSELHAVESFLDLILVHLLKIAAWQDSEAVPHWRAQIVAFRKNARRRFAPSMAGRIDLESIYAGAIEEMNARTGGAQPTWPERCPFTLDEVLHGEPDTLQQRLSPA